ncbi:MAG: hypothetical protein JNL97_14565, partial [Verrucomicrobiales bacterium]|nr:hypothetical protein [Verrucomicrobiales bacterium]
MTPAEIRHLAHLCPYSRRRFLQAAGLAVSGMPWFARAVDDDGDEVSPATPRTAPPPPVFSPSVRAAAKVAVLRCREFGAEYHRSLARAFDLLGGIGGLVRGKTVTVKLNLTGTNFDPIFGRPVGESYMTHPDTAFALARLLFDAGARRIRFVESNQRIEPLEQTVTDGGWDVKA